VSVEITNLPEVVAALNGFARRERDKAEREVRRAAMNVHNEAKRRVPKDLGRLSNSITYEISGDGLTATVGTNLEYAREIEFGRRAGSMPPPGVLLGWMKRKGIDPSLEFVIRRKIAEKGTPPQPYLLPALEVVRPDFLARMSRLER
jgi:HK97 gp10 family phage protein